MATSPLHERAGRIWLNGTVVDSAAAQVHVLSHTLHYGTGVFEGIRVYDGRPFAALAHFRRLLRSARHVGFAITSTAEQLDRAAIEVIRANNIEDGYIRAIAWLGSENLGLGAEGLSVNLAIAAWDWPRVYADDGDAGVSLHLSGVRRPSPQTLPPQAKATGAYLIGAMAYQQARAKGFQDGLLLDQEGYLAEGSTANLFLVRDGVLLSPTPDRFLDGLTRQFTIEIASRLGIETVTRRIAPHELAEAEEAFLCGTAVEILPVRRVDTTELRPGPVGARLRQAYAEFVRDPAAAERNHFETASPAIMATSSDSKVDSP